MKALSILILLSSALAIEAAAPPPAVPAGVAPTEAIPETVALPRVVAPQAKMVPSRYVDSGYDDYFLTLKQRLAINTQDRGPFGLYQNPTKGPIIASPIRKATKKTPFSDYINRIDISVINSQEKEFLVGARMFRLGQVFPIVSGGDRMSVRVESVHPSQVSFKNIESGEVAARKLNVLPAGITANAGALQVQGVTPNRRGEEAPLHLDFNSPPPTP